MAGAFRRAEGRRAAAGAVAALLALAAAPARPLDTVRGALGRIEAVMAGVEGRDARLAALREIAAELLDTRTMGRVALGPVLAEQPAGQREEFRRLFDALMLRSYLQRLLLFREPRFEVAGEQVEGRRAIVHTRIVTSRDTYSVDYEMRREDGRWRATDVVVEGISQNRNYRSQLRRLLRSLTFPELLERMRGKVASLQHRDAR